MDWWVGGWMSERIGGWLGGRVNHLANVWACRRVTGKVFERSKAEASVEAISWKAKSWQSYRDSSCLFVFEAPKESRLFIP